VNYESEYVGDGWPTFSGHLFFCNDGVHTTSGRVAASTSLESAIHPASSGATSRSASTSVRKRTRSISLLRSTSYMFLMATKRDRQRSQTVFALRLCTECCLRLD